MGLIEREAALDDLRAWEHEAHAGDGRLVWLYGDAGIGKSSLIRMFIEGLDPHIRASIGACEPLSTPRPLGPLVDVAHDLGPNVVRMLYDGTPRDLLFLEVNRCLHASTEKRVVVFEDVHWADQATLDLLQYLGRRLRGTRTLLIATYRNDEVTPEHPLLGVVGNLATSGSVRRLELRPLTQAGVAELAVETGLDAVDLHRRTGGNPFFVSEVLAAPGQTIPGTVRDAVLARVARFAATSRDVLEAAAVIGFRVEPSLLGDIVSHAVTGIDDCLRVGLLVSRGTLLEFRHELAREAVLATVSAPRRLLLDQRILEILETAGIPHVYDLAPRLAHHAEAAGDADAVMRHAPVAARRAADLKAHREAAAQYRRALEHAPGDQPDLRAELLEARAYECYLTSDVEAALAARSEALAIRRRSGDSLREGENLRWISRLSWFRGARADAHAAAQMAIDVLERHPGSRELGWAYSSRSQLHMLANEDEPAVRWGERALAIGHAANDPELQAHASTNIGTVGFCAGDSHGREMLEAALRLAREHDLDEHVARAYTNLASTCVSSRQVALADHYLEQGIEYCIARDLDAWHLYMLGWQAVCRLHQGRWSEAGTVARDLLTRPNLPAVSRIQPLVVLAHLRSRRGDDEALAPLREARMLAEATGEVQRLAPVAVAEAEWAWLTSAPDADLATVRNTLALACAVRRPSLAGELHMWLAKIDPTSADGADRPDRTLAAPYAVEVAGEARGAADAWLALGCPFDAARALAGSREERDLHEAHAGFARLGATAGRALVERRLDTLGLRGPPRGPRPSTRANPANLTRRQQQVLELMATGMSNPQIADELVRSTKTIDHHVSAVLMKLAAQNRTEAVRKAIQIGLVSPTPHP